MKFYGMIKAHDNAAGKRVNPIVALDVSDDPDWHELWALIDSYCVRHDLAYTAFFPYGPGENGRERFEEYTKRQDKIRQQKTPK